MYHRCKCHVFDETGVFHEMYVAGDHEGFFTYYIKGHARAVITR